MDDPTGVKPIADATKEVAIATGKGFDLVGSFGLFLDKTLGESFRHAGGMLGDRLHFWRRMNMLKLQAEFNDACERQGVDPETLRPIPLGQLIQVMDAAALEEDETVLKMWAELLAKAPDARNGATIKKFHLALLKEIGPAEASLLHLLWRIIAALVSADRPLQTADKAEYRAALEERLVKLTPQWRAFSRDDQTAAIANLVRLGCLEGRLRPDRLAVAARLRMRRPSAAATSVIIIAPSGDPDEDASADQCGLQ